MWNLNQQFSPIPILYVLAMAWYNQNEDSSNPSHRMSDLKITPTGHSHTNGESRLCPYSPSSSFGESPQRRRDPVLLIANRLDDGLYSASWLRTAASLDGSTIVCSRCYPRRTTNILAISCYPHFPINSEWTFLFTRIRTGILLVKSDKLPKYLHTNYSMQQDIFMLS